VWKGHTATLFSTRKGCVCLTNELDACRVGSHIKQQYLLDILSLFKQWESGISQPPPINPSLLR
jgi:hypothetical protein